MFDTARDEDFRHDVWKENLTINEIKDIEEHCSQVMKKLNYPKYTPDQ